MLFHCESQMRHETIVSKIALINPNALKNKAQGEAKPMTEWLENKSLVSILRDEIKKYAGAIETPVGPSKFYFVENLDDQLFGLVVPHLSLTLPAELLMLAHLENDQIIIDSDTTNKPLADALRQAGIPDAPIVLSWLRRERAAD
jgi:hypothetical protein